MDVTPPTPSFADPSDPIDLTNCDREPIHLLGHVQAFGCLLAVSSDWLIRHASVNVADYLGRPAESLIGTPLRDVVSAQVIHDVRSRLQVLQDADASEHLFGVALRPDLPRRFDISIHRSGGSVVLEFEPTDESGRGDYAAHVRPLVQRVQKADTAEDLCRGASRQVKALTGFDRVMVYRFADDGSGEVVAETHKPGLESFLGLHYPASDIPRQARALYARNLLRIISDVDGRVSAIIPERDPSGAPLDLSLSCLRAVSPIHLEYLRNMGVKASMSISIMVRGKLWGLFACHHYAPRVLTSDVRTAAELFGQLFAFLLDQRETDQAREQAEKARALHDRLMVQMAEGESIAANFEPIAKALGTVIPCDGVVAWVDGQFLSTGATPTAEEFPDLARFLNTTTASRVYACAHLEGMHPPARAYLDRAAGLLALPVSRVPRDYIVLFRREVAETVHWAGDPTKPVDVGPNGVRLTPRKSFELWQEVVHGHCKTWTSAEIAAAETLRVTLLEVVLRLSEAANEQQAKAQERQELLIAELNHRVRNILNLIRGLVTQSRSEVKTVAEFTEVVGGRIHALAMAHDQITKENWAPASLRQLIATEVEAYLIEGKAHRVEVNGPDALLDPQAFLTVSLVLHELLTNSMKYGALTDSRGRLLIDLVRAPDGGLAMTWREQGGPPVKAPERRGFGSTIIERSIPFELKGEAQVHFHPSGLIAEFRIPADRVDGFRDAPPPEEEPVVAEPSCLATVLGTTMILEDNMIIALDAEELIREMGARQVLTAASVAEADRILDENTVDFCLLDVNLGAETSAPVARRLVAEGVPFVFATGYGEAQDLRADFPDVPIIQKPYGSDSLAAVLTGVLEGGEGG